MRLGSAALGAWVAIASGCATLPTEPVHPPPKAPPARVATPPPVPAFHWEPLEVSVDPAIVRARLPLADAEVELVGGASAYLGTLPSKAREAIMSQGFAVIDRPGAPPTFGELYRELVVRDLPLVISVDALAETAHLAIDAALDAVDRAAIEPALKRLLARWSARFEAMNKKVPSDVVRPLRMARGIVAVARKLLDDEAAVPADLATDVRDETRRVREQTRVLPSLVLQVPIDYGAVSSSRAEKRSGLADALGWLTLAPFVLIARDVEGGSPAGVALSRDHARAALLFAHATHPRVDAEAAAAFARIDAIETFLIGPSDDWSPVELAELATRHGIDVLDVAALVDVPRIDRMRRAAAGSFRARVHDGSGAPAGVRTPEPAREPPGNRFVSRFVTPTVRVMGARLGQDAIVQQAMVAPVVGSYRGNRTVMTLGDGKRTLSRALDFAVVLGSEEARDALRSEGDDAYDELDATLRRLVERRPPEREAARHASVYLSALDLVSTMLTASAADASVPAALQVEFRRRGLESALATYATIRRDFTLRARRASEKPIAIAQAASPPRVLVEPHPEAIGRMVSMIRQLGRGLTAYGALPPDGPAAAIVSSAERILNTAFQAALLAANAVAPNDEQTRALAAMPSAIAGLERATASKAARAVDMHVDLARSRVLAQGTGRLAELVMVVRDPRDGRLVVSVGAASSHHETIHSRRDPMTDAEWRTKLERGALTRAPWTTGYRFALGQN